MIKQLGLAAAVLTAMLLPTVPASAHVLASDGDIGAVLHINPDDNPTSGTPTNYILAFDDTNNKLRLSNCDCNVVIQEGGKTISTTPLVVSGELNSSDMFTFPKPAVYTLTVSGKPKAGRAFQSFSISYTVRVTSGTMQAQEIPAMLWIGLGGMMGLVLLAAYAMGIGYNDEQKN